MEEPSWGWDFVIPPASQQATQALWKQILEQNREEVLRAIDGFEASSRLLRALCSIKKHPN
jgi:prephenate dehydrogenase